MNIAVFFRATQHSHQQQRLPRGAAQSTFVHTMRSLITRLGNHCQGRADNDTLSPRQNRAQQPFCAVQEHIVSGRENESDGLQLLSGRFICAALMVLQTAIITSKMHSQFMMCLLEILLCKTAIDSRFNL